jgi:hypothetical protein
MGSADVFCWAVVFVQAQSLGYNLCMERDTPAVVFRYKLWIRLTLLFLLLILLVLVGWIVSISVRMVLRLSEPFMMALAIPSVLVSLVGLLVSVLFGYTVLFYWTYRLEFAGSHLETRTIDYPLVRPFHCAYGDIVRVRRGIARGLLEIVPRQGRPLRVGAWTLAGQGESLIEELFKRVDDGCIQPNFEDRLWKYAWFDYFRLVVAAVIFISQFGLFGLSVGRNIMLALGLPRRLFDWVLIVASLEMRLALLTCGLIVVGIYVVVYVWRWRVWQSGSKQG